MLASSSGSGVNVGAETTTGGVALDRIAQAGSVSISSSSAPLLFSKGIVESLQCSLLGFGMFGLEPRVPGRR